MARANVTTEAGRLRLSPRREPYFTKIAKGQHLGFRKLEVGGTWIARYQIGTSKVYHAIGAESDFAEYKDVLTTAVDWFRDTSDDDRPNDKLTVAIAIADYVRDLAVRKSEDSAKRTAQSAAKHVPKSLANTEVSKLTTKKIKAWRDDLVADSKDTEVIRRSKDTANRNLSILKAALNLAFQNGSVRSDAAWRRVKPFKDVNRARDVFLTTEQCRALLNACEPDFRSLVRSALITGCRYGELVRRTVRDLDLKQCTLSVPDGKTGARVVVLSDAAAQHFRELAKDKLPTALLHYREENGKDEETGKPITELEPWGKSEQARRIKAALNAANREIKKHPERFTSTTCFYSLRHTHASLALLAGVNIQVLAENMGTSVRMIEKHYGKFMQADRRTMFNAVMLP